MYMKYTRLTKEYFDSLDPESSHVLVCATGAALPVSFIAHTYIVTVQGGVARRYDVIHHASQRATGKDYLYINYYKPWQGILRVYKKNGKGEGARSHPYLAKKYSGEDAAQAISKIKEVYQNYPYKHTYRFWWPNCNTFTAWLLAEVGLDIKLPRTAIGKNFFKK